MEREINEEFEYNGKKLVVEDHKQTVYNCTGCFFINRNCHSRFAMESTGACEAISRKDHKNVIFKDKRL